MFDIGWTELVVIAVVAIVVIGPKDLPRAMRTVGKWSGKMKRMARDFQNQFNEAIREAELDEVKKEVAAIARIDPMADLKKDLAKTEASIRTDLAKPAINGKDADLAGIADETGTDEPAPTAPAAEPVMPFSALPTSVPAADAVPSPPATGEKPANASRSEATPEPAENGLSSEARADKPATPFRAGTNPAPVAETTP